METVKLQNTSSLDVVVSYDTTPGVPRVLVTVAPKGTVEVPAALWASGYVTRKWPALVEAKAAVIVAEPPVEEIEAPKEFKKSKGR